MMMAVHQHLPLKFTECRKSPFLYPHYIHAVTQHAARLSESGDEPALQQLQNIWMTPESWCAAAGGPFCLEIEVQMDGCCGSHLSLFFYRQGRDPYSDPNRN